MLSGRPSKAKTVAFRGMAVMMMVWRDALELGRKGALGAAT
jgi:hypothetical protein